MTKTKIEWATDVWNPVTGCTKVSQGCKNCYAERVAERFWGERRFAEVRVHPERLHDPTHWRKPRRIFVNSMSDLFHVAVSDKFIESVFSTMMDGATQHTYLILTKLPERMMRFVIDSWVGAHMMGPIDYSPNIWLGVSCEDQRTADERIPLLLQTPAAVRFVSVEPMLGEVNLCNLTLEHNYFLNSLTGKEDTNLGPEEEWNKLDWVICGGESGPGARPMHPDWVRGLRDQCQVAGVPFFFKQWGEWTTEYPSDLSLASRAMTFQHGMTFYRVGKAKAGRVLDGRTWDEYPEHC